MPRAEAEGHIAQVAFPEAEVVQRRTVRAGESDRLWRDLDRANATPQAAIVNIGYADGYLRCFAGKGGASVGGARLPLIGRVSMDLVALDCSARAGLGRRRLGDAGLRPARRRRERRGLSQYELLTGLSQRLERRWS